MSARRPMMSGMSSGPAFSSSSSKRSIQPRLSKGNRRLEMGEPLLDLGDEGVELGLGQLLRVLLAEELDGDVPRLLCPVRPRLRRLEGRQHLGEVGQLLRLLLPVRGTGGLRGW